MKFLRTYVEDKIESKLSDEEWLREFASLFTKQTYVKGQELLSAGEVCNTFYYISSGTVRTYTIDTAGKEQTWALHINQDSDKLDVFVGDYHSFYIQNESNFYAEAFTDVVVYKAEFSALNALFENNFMWMKLGKGIFEEQVVLLMERKKMMTNLTAKERYMVMQKIAPIYEELLPDYQFASVLGIAPQSLSRIKKEMKSSHL